MKEIELTFSEKFSLKNNYLVIKINKLNFKRRKKLIDEFIMDKKLSKMKFVSLTCLGCFKTGRRI